MTGDDTIGQHRSRGSPTFNSSVRTNPSSSLLVLFPSTSTYFIRSSVSQFSRSVVSDSLRPRGLQHARPPCPLPTPGVHPNPCPLSRDAIESVMPSNHLILCHPFLLLPSIFPSIRVFSNELALCIRLPKY